MSDLRDLYQTMILDHGRRPRNLRKLERANQIGASKNAYIRSLKVALRTLRKWQRIPQGSVPVVLQYLVDRL